MADIHKITKNGETILPATTTDAIVHPQMETSLTNMINEYNVSKLFPTGGVDGGDTYTLEGAIALLNSKLTASQKTVGIKLAFKDNGSENNDLVEYQYNGGTFTGIENWYKFIEIPHPQKIVTFKDSGYISLDDTSDENNRLYPNDSSNSNFMGLIFNPLRNKTYTFNNIDYFGSSSITYYKGKVNRSAVRVLRTTSITITFTTPDIDFDFAILNIQKVYNDNQDFRPIESIGLSCLETSDIIDNSITKNKLESSVNELIDYSSEKLKVILNNSEITSKEVSSVVNPSNSGAITKDTVWDNGSKTEVDGGNFGTFELEIPSNAIRVNINNYNFGVSNGAFLTLDKSYISGIDNSILDLKNLTIPSNAKYIDVTYSESNGINSDIIFYIKQTKYTLPDLSVYSSQIVDNNITKNNQWFGKKLCIIGTSVAYGSNAENAYAKIASERLGFDIIPAGVPGQAIHAKIDSNHDNIIAPLTYGSTCLSKSEYEAARTAGASTITISANPKPIDGEDWDPGNDSNYNSYYRTWENIFTEDADASLWIFATGPNNENFNLDDWNAFDKNNWKYSDDSSFSEHRTTFLGAMLFLMDKMYELGNDQRMILVIDSAFNYTQVKEAFELLHNQWNIPIIDLWNKINTTPKSLVAVKSNNGTDSHPSTFGQERMGDIFTNELLLIS